MPRKMAFIHIPKTAGTSFTKALRAAWPRTRIIATAAEFISLSMDEINQIDLIAGHYYAYQWEKRRIEGFDSVTVLRDPFDRLFSAYRFSRQCVRLGLQVNEAMRLAAQVSFGEWAFSAFGRTEAHSQLYILGLNAGDNARLVSLETLLERSKDRLSRIHVGTTAQLDDLIDLVFRHSGQTMPPPAIGHAMVGEKRSLEEAGMTAREQGELMERLRPDYELHRFGQELLLRRLESAQGTPDRAVERRSL